VWRKLILTFSTLVCSHCTLHSFTYLEESFLKTCNMSQVPTMLKLTPVNLVQQSSESNFAACIFCSATLHASGNFQTASFQVFPVCLRLSLSISFSGCYKWSNVWARSPLLLVWIAC
jgi:hypothetical protein